MKKFFLLSIIMCLTGCFPVYKTLQPDATITVLDENKRPIEGAEVALTSSAYPYQIDKSRAYKQTDVTGKVHFDAIEEWRIESLLPHGTESYYWQLCTTKSGYETEEKRIGHFQDHYFSSDYTVLLKYGTTRACRKTSLPPADYLESRN